MEEDDDSELEEMVCFFYFLALFRMEIANGDISVGASCWTFFSPPLFAF